MSGRPRKEMMVLVVMVMMVIVMVGYILPHLYYAVLSGPPSPPPPPTPQGHFKISRTNDNNNSGGGACSKVYFLTSEQQDSRLENVIVSKYSRYDDLWGKVLDGFHSLDPNSSQWFVKADDDTYLVRHNLVALLSGLDAAETHYIGLPLVYSPKDGKPIEFNSGGAGYVLSHSTLRLLQQTTTNKNNIHECQYPGYTSYEDVNMGVCMKALGVAVTDTRDTLGRSRFLPYPPRQLLNSNLEGKSEYAWLQTLSKYPFHFGPEYLSDQAISFHQIRQPVDLYLIHFLIHDLHLLTSVDSRPFHHLPN
ncbi:hypothetical protein Pcinc_029632 [Petrolisthes cinctipes]|uniref:N-acetylgalactosaminide beta-1,3-galactosyltransferase n=1 Tax=Petrolisthes cinctipes TaxID=88211 RepID=A0AAE1EZX6_PETCI|nr:hypothetical protein Pcinc_029632 [Petrolisthes cinctipes]